MSSSIGRRYARALLELANEASQTPKVRRDFDALVATWNESRELRDVFENPAVTAEMRASVLDAISKRLGLAPIMVNRMIAKIKELKERRSLTVLMAEQNFNQAIKIADRGYIIVHGEIAFEGKSARDLQDNDMVKQYYLGA